MKKVIVLIALLTAILIGCNKSGASDSLSWEENLETALQKAKTENKAVLVNFTGSDWCQWCIKLSNEVFSKSEFEDYAKDNLILVRIDFPQSIEQSAATKSYNTQLAQKFGIQGYPTILLFNSIGTLVLTTGYQPGGPVSYVEHLKNSL
ncbi:MAG: thioredoxin family protein [Ignavibacteria bacterium]|nr:thioredoxin family protein [Ignavibacteria bacterium]